MARKAKAKFPKNLDRALYNGDSGADNLFTGSLKLLGTWEVASLLGVEKPRIARWLERNSMPQPVARLKCGPVWLATDIEAFLPTVEEGRKRRTPVRV